MIDGQGPTNPRRIHFQVLISGLLYIFVESLNLLIEIGDLPFYELDRGGGRMDLRRQTNGMNHPVAVVQSDLDRTVEPSAAIGRCWRDVREAQSLDRH
jgi:hypothetical protein